MLRYLKDQAIEAAENNQARNQGFEKGRETHACGTFEPRAEGAQGKPEDDFRLVSPKSMTEAQVIEAALEKTKSHYMDLTNDYIAPSPPPFENYMTQWRFFQDKLNKHWIRTRLQGDPPKLFLLGPWTGGLKNWKSLREQDISSF